MTPNLIPNGPEGKVTCSIFTNTAYFVKTRKNPKRWREAYICQTGDAKAKTTSKEAMNKRAKERAAELGITVKHRLNTAISDLQQRMSVTMVIISQNFMLITLLAPAAPDCLRRMTMLLKIFMESRKTTIRNSVEIFTLQAQTDFRGHKLTRRSLVMAPLDHVKPDLMI